MAHRVTDARDFAATTRSGRRGASGTVIVHVRTGAAEDPQSPPRVGLVVGRAVGNSVVRHRVQRRLRHQVRGLLAQLPPGSSTVVRARPSAATATSARLRADLETALGRVDAA